MTRMFLPVLFSTLALIMAAHSRDPPILPASTRLLFTPPLTYLVPQPTTYFTYLTLPTSQITGIPGGTYSVTCPPIGPSTAEDCKPRADGCIVCLCDTKSAGFCKVRGGNCTLNYFKEEQLTPYEYDVDIELLREDSSYTGNICDPAAEQTYQEGDVETSQSNFSDIKYPYQTNRPQLTCANADAINILDNKLIGIDDNIEEFINFEKCDTTNIQCHHLEPEIPSWDPHLTIENQEILSRNKRASGSVNLRYVTAASGQSTLRSVPMQGGCPATNMCIRRGRCCALVIFGNNGMIGCPRRC